MGKETKTKRTIPEISAQEQEYRNIMADIFFNMFGGKRWKVASSQKMIQGKAGTQPKLFGGTDTTRSIG